MQESNKVSANRYQEKVRQSMSNLPSWMQPFVTLVTGKPLPVEPPPRFLLSGKAAFSLDICLLLSLCALQIAALIHYPNVGYACLPVFWVVETGLMRKMQVVYLHHIVHNALFASKRVNTLWGDILAGTLFVQNLFEYKKSHINHHNNGVFTTRHDDDAAFLYQLGFRPGRSARFLWWLLLATMISPHFHGLFAYARVKSAIWTSGGRAKFVSFLAVATFVAMFVVLPWHVILLAIFMPLFPLYHISALLQFLTEHAWMVTEHAPRDKKEYADRCWGRFCGEKLPSCYGWERIVRWFFWSLRMIFIHMPYRYGCLVGDLPAHDWHHLCHLVSHSHKTWPEGIYMRQRAIDNQFSLGMESREIWGLHDALAHVFELLEKTNPRLEKTISHAEMAGLEA